MEITEELIRQLVMEVVEKIEALRAQAAQPTPAGRSVRNFGGRVLSAWDVECCFREKVDCLQMPRKTIITPLAAERARDLGVKLDLQ
jgi:hypothetical protein